MRIKKQKPKRVSQTLLSTGRGFLLTREPDHRRRRPGAEGELRDVTVTTGEMSEDLEDSGVGIQKAWLRWRIALPYDLRDLLA